jgi:hypothetical protein
MKQRNPVILSRYITGKLKRQDILSVDALYVVTYRGEPITIAVVDEDITHSATPRFQNNLYSQEKSAQNAANKLNATFDTDQFVVKQVRLID